MEDEARHFELLRQRLEDTGYAYGDFPAHDGLWDMARRSAHDPLVPRATEAWGLDVTSGMRERFRRVGDEETAAALDVILRGEVGHVTAGSLRFCYLCVQRGQDPEGTYFDLLEEFLHGEIRCPLQRGPRRRAGFSESELNRLEVLCRKNAS